jgi:hypothetical protein
MKDNFLSTKFIGTMVVIVLAYGLVFVGKLDAKSWLELAVASVGIFSAANVAQKFVQPDEK